jgi:hypothetical protein
MLNFKVWVAGGVSLWLVSSASTALAHHSVAGFFDASKVVEIEGTVTAAIWRNPHTVFEIDVPGPSGESTSWRIETGALSVFRARGLDHEFLRVGDHVKVAGDASLRDRYEIFARNLLLSDGEEVMLTVGSKPYFSRQGEAELIESVYDDALVAAARRNADGIFRVWSTNIEEFPPSGLAMFDRDYALSPEAEAERASWNPGDEVLLGCTEWNMPRLMANPLPIEFVREGDRIRMRFEEDDNERMIHMVPESAGHTEEHSLLGYSTGRWDGDSLIVETTNIKAGRLDDSGTPFSADIRLLERFTPSADGARLDYRIDVTDPNSFVEPFEARRYWVWRPEISVQSYACEQAQDLK